MPKFLELQHTCMDLAHKKEIVRLDDEIEKTRNMLVKFALKTDVNEKFRKVEQELWEELALKQEKTVFDRKIEHFENEAEIEKKSVNKQLSSIREVTDRMRRKVEETSHAMIEVKSETDTKLSAKEGQKLWANFRKYAQYEELKELYRKTMPAISAFEDKL